MVDGLEGGLWTGRARPLNVNDRIEQDGLLPNDPGGLSPAEPLPAQTPRPQEQPRGRYSTSPEIRDMQEGMERIERWQQDLMEEDRRQAPQRQPQERQVRGVQLAQQTEAQFNAAPDKVAALERLTPQFEEAIRRSDYEGEGAIKYARGSLQIMRPARDQAEARERSASALMMQAMAAVPSEDMPFVTERLKAFEHSVTDNGKQQIIHELGKRFPMVAGAMRANISVVSENAALHARERQLKERVEQSVNNRMDTRYTFAEALERGGNRERADQLRKEAMDIFIGMITAEERAKSRSMQPPSMPEEPLRPREFSI